MELLERAGNLIWDPWLLAGFLGLGLYLTLRTGFFQLFEGRLWLRTTVGSLLRNRRAGKGKGLSQVQALSTALASTIGTGSIAGVATAIFFGGPGAVFWMWVSAFLGMMTGCIEKLLSVRYRRRASDGGWQGGPMEYMEAGLHSRRMALCFSLFCILASLGGGNLVQSNSIAMALEAAFGWDRLAVGCATALLTGVVILGGIGRIGQICEKLVPVMGLLFLAGGAAALLAHGSKIPAVLESIVREAFAPKAAFGGAGGYGMAAAMRYGVARGVFTNEAGLGSSAMVHGAARTEEAAEEGMWGIFEVFIATLVICTVTALVILTSGVYSEEAALRAIQSGEAGRELLGAALSAEAFSVTLGRWGKPFVAVCLLMFAFSSLLGWSYYGERGLGYLMGSDRWVPVYRVVFLACVVVGSVGDVSGVWQVADICNGLMAAPNLLALLLLSPQALEELRRWTGRQR